MKLHFRQNLTICYKRNRNGDTWKGVKEEKVAESYTDGGLETESKGSSFEGTTATFVVQSPELPTNS